MAGIIDLLSNNSSVGFTSDQLRKLAVPGTREDGSSKEVVTYRPHELSKRLGAKKVAELVGRCSAGESVRSLARELGVANSALTRMLREQGVEISKRRVSDAEVATMAHEYEAGATMRELEEKHGLSHGAVYRALHRVGVQMRASTPRRRT